MGDITAFVGAAGGVGTTRLTLEAAATLSRDGESVAVLDAAYATQGLADHLEGRIDPDVTALVTEDRPLSEGLHELSVATDGRVACAPARAPFARLARAKSPDAAQRFERLAEAAAAGHDAVLLDVPPVAANQSVAAVNVADRTAVVAPGTPRGRDLLARTRDRLADVDGDVDAAVATRSDGVDWADAAVPESGTTAPGAVPVCDEADGGFAAGVAAATAAATGRDLDVEFGGGLLL
ncbi:ParA family protein [Halorarius halobius]|uniref:ParA family protein n=1 Tax=Halorarius halobius TaxID=2962671 RepID=UPI0020CD0F08|nr:ParA family protein [Halorarius halobius]